MQSRCAMRFESHIPTSLAMRKSYFASDAKAHSLDLKSQENAKKKLRKSCDVGLQCEKSGRFFKIERCEMPAIRTPAAVWPAMRAPAMPNRGSSDASHQAQPPLAHHGPARQCGLSFHSIFFIHARSDWTTGVPDDGNEWRKFCVVPRVHHCVPLFCTLFDRDGNRGAFRLPGEVGGSFPLYGGTFARSYSVSNLGSFGL